MGLGVALNSDKPVVVLDGDGAALMKMGTFATMGAYAPRNLVHILLDNGMHDSTGGQATVSGSIDFAMIAQACGYRTAWTCDEAGGFKEAMAAVREVGPQGHFLGTQHTLEHFEKAFFSPSIMDFNSFEQWSAEGAKDHATRGRDKARQMLKNYEPPKLDEGIAEGLQREFGRWEALFPS